MDVDAKMNELIYLCEIRGELSPEDNAKVEAAITKLESEIAAAIPNWLEEA
jgi:hypothetical protein